MLSHIQERGLVAFPKFTGERIYMREFRKVGGLPEDLRRWQPTIDAMLRGIETDGSIYLMIDQREVRAGEYHRRPGLHVDGSWDPIGGIHPAPGPPGHRFLGVAPYPCEGIVLASDVTASRAFEGEFEGIPEPGNDCAHISTAGMREVVLRAGHIYGGNVSMLHESFPVESDCKRTLVRLNIPGWEPEP